MKKILILLLSVFLLTSCFNTPEKGDIDDAKKDMLWEDYKSDDKDDKVEDSTASI